MFASVSGRFLLLVYQALCRHPPQTANSLAESVDQRLCLNLSQFVNKFLERLLF